MNKFLSGAGFLFRGFKLIRQPGIRPFVWIPLTINVLVFSLAIVAALSGFEYAMDFLTSRIPTWLHWLRYLLWPLFVVTLTIVVFYSFALIANLLAAPFNGLLAEAVARVIEGKAPAEQNHWKALAADILPSLWSEFRKLLYALKWLLPCAILFIIPGLNLFAPAVWLLFSAWMLAVEYSDYPLDNCGMKFSAQRKAMKRERALSLGFGAATLLVTLVPVVNFFAMPAAVAGATAMWLAREDSSSTTRPPPGISTTVN